jgi:hypothetical protein
MRYASSRVGECYHRGSDPHLGGIAGGADHGDAPRIEERRERGACHRTQRLRLGPRGAYQTLKPGTFIGDVVTSLRRTGP